MKPTKEQVKKNYDEAVKANMRAELSKYIKSSGGLRKGLTKEQIKRAAEIKKVLDTK